MRSATCVEGIDLRGHMEGSPSDDGAPSPVSRGVNARLMGSRARANFEQHNADIELKQKEKELDEAKLELQVANAERAGTAAAVQKIQTTGDMAHLYTAKQKGHDAQMRSSLAEANVIKKAAEVERMQVETAKSRIGSDLRKAQDECEVARAEVAELKTSLRRALERDTAKAESNELLRAELDAAKRQVEQTKGAAERLVATAKEEASRKFAASMAELMQVGT